MKMWNYASLEDETHIFYSNLHEDGSVSIAIERPHDWGFDSAKCLMPSYARSDVNGFSDEEVADIESFLRDNAPLIFELSEASYDERLIA